MTIAYDLLIAQKIDTDVAGLTLGDNLFAGPIRGADDVGGVAHKAVFVTASGGLFSEPLHDDNRRTLRRPGVQIRIRSDQGAGAFQTGQQLARDVYDTVDQDPPAGICDVRALDSAPSYLGEDEDGHHEWSINLSLLLEVIP